MSRQISFPAFLLVVVLGLVHGQDTTVLTTVTTTLTTTLTTTFSSTTTTTLSSTFSSTPSSTLSSTPSSTLSSTLSSTPSSTLSSILTSSMTTTPTMSWDYMIAIYSGSGTCNMGTTFKTFTVKAGVCFAWPTAFFITPAASSKINSKGYYDSYNNIVDSSNTTVTGQYFANAVCSGSNLAASPFQILPTGFSFAVSGCLGYAANEANNIYPANAWSYTITPSTVTGNNAYSCTCNKVAADPSCTALKNTCKEKAYSEALTVVKYPSAVTCPANANPSCDYFSTSATSDCATICGAAGVAGNLGGIVPVPGVPGSPPSAPAPPSSPSADAPSPSPAPCFPSSSTVELVNGERKRMDELKIGDMVLTGYKKSSPVYLFSHADADSDTLFVRLEFNSVLSNEGSGGGVRGEVGGGNLSPLQPLTLSPGHFIYIVDESAASSEFINGKINLKAIPARDVRMGDIVQTNNERAEVVGIFMVRAKGLYNPHTLDGDIIVDGILTTVYTDAIRPEFAHALLAPVRALYKMNVSVGG